MTTLARMLRALAALVALVAVVIGLPAALATWGTSPVRGGLSVEAVRDVLAEPSSDRVIAGALTIAAWVVWLLFLRALAVELVAARRARAGVAVRSPRRTIA